MAEHESADQKSAEQALKRTPLHALHVELGAKMVPFAGWEMPVQYPMGVKNEHLHTRAKVGLFDVSHMGQVRIIGDDPAVDMERLVPGDLAGLALGHTRYTLLTNDAGGIIDDLMVTNAGDQLFVVVNASRRDVDLAHMADALESRVVPLDDRALLALQGPAAAGVLATLAPDTAKLTFMQSGRFRVAGHDCYVNRSGYTGEDGFEISIAADAAEALARTLLDHGDVAPIGLGARDTLRLEAGLCLYGHDIDEETTLVEAALSWTVAKRRRETGGFPGADVILGQLRDGTARKRVGIQPDGRAPARDGTVVAAKDGTEIGRITSGGFGPSLDRPVAMGYVATAQAAVGTEIDVVVRGKPLPAHVAKLPFVPQRYHKG